MSTTDNKKMLIRILSKMLVAVRLMLTPRNNMCVRLSSCLYLNIPIYTIIRAVQDVSTVYCRSDYAKYVHEKRERWANCFY